MNFNDGMKISAPQKIFNFCFFPYAVKEKGISL